MKRSAFLAVPLMVAILLLPSVPLQRVVAHPDYEFSFPNFHFTISPNGNVYQLESPMGYEHIAEGFWGEGYTVVVSGEGDMVAYDVYGDSSDVTYVGSLVMQNTPSKVLVGTVTTAMDLIRIDQFFVASKTSRYIGMKIVIRNIADYPLSGVVFKRWVDMDTDTGGSLGWSDFMNYFNYIKPLNLAYSYTSYAQGPPPGRTTHYFGMMGWPTVTTWDLDGWDDYDRRLTDGNVQTGPYLEDLAPILHWDVGTMAPNSIKVFYVAYGIGDNMGEMLANTILGWQAAMAIPYTIVPLPG